DDGFALPEVAEIPQRPGVVGVDEACRREPDDRDRDRLEMLVAER
ncbi:MAG: hypothetical protein JWO62_3630, partial [Acidimicrobiaceae bacterium]|nr:hypothetical protein [Acidimicrobiaceae bacterium]